MEKIEFHKIHRFGTVQGDKQSARPIVAKLGSHKHVLVRLSFNETLSKQRKDAVQGPSAKPTSLRITPQYPIEMRERRKLLIENSKKEKAKDGGTQTKIVGEFLYVIIPYLVLHLSALC